MPPLEDLEGDCYEEELSEAQVEFYRKALKEHEEALAEANNIKKGSSVSKQGNIWTVKSTYQVKLQNAATLSNLVMSQSKQSVPGSIAIQTNPPSAPGSTGLTRLQPLLPAAAQPTIPATGVTRTVAQQIALPVRSAQPSITQTTTLVTYTNKKTLQELVPLQPKPQILLQTPQVNITKPIKVVAQPTSHLAPPSPPQPAPQSSLPTAPPKQPPAVQITRSIQVAQTAQATQPRNPTISESSTEDPRQAIKTIPSLSVIVKQSHTLPEIICQKKRETLDGFVKSRLVLDPRKFAEWLMQVGLARNKQTGICRFHSPVVPVPLQLRMYEDTTKFPNSGGYVWMTKCCDKTYVSIFRDSIFEDSPHPPTVLLKLIYHWACQTSVNNVVQWVKVDHNYIRLFYAMLRSACTVEVQSSTPVFGLSTINNRVEIGVISLGTTSSDGKRRDVKVEVLGVYDQESRKFRLRASVPVVGETKGKHRFTRILEPLQKWVSKNALILTDQTVDRSALNDLGFENVLQKSLSSSTIDDPLTNRTVMEYMRKVVPKVFQSSLSALNTATIQQFLDELLWREMHGQSHADAFHSMVRDLSAQSRAETGMALIKRLTLIAVNPFKDWGLTSKHATCLLAEPQPHVSSILGGMKRPAPMLKDTSHVAEPSVPKEQRISSHYATMQDLRKETHADPRDAEVFCQIPNCKKFAKSNIEMMDHMRNHLIKETAPHQIHFTEHCNYCLTSFPDAEQRAEHESKFHTFITSFSVGMGKVDSAVIKDLVCLICHDKFPAYRDLEQHLEKSHVLYEMPYRCRVCYFHSSSHSLFIDHFHDTHKTSTQLVCPLCLEVFSIKGDNLANTPDVGHLKYLDHLKTHVKVPAENRPRCKKCVLTFIEHDKLVSHWKCEHLTFSNSLMAKPFTYIIIKPQTPAVAPQVQIAQVPLGKHYTAATSTAATATTSTKETSTEATEAVTTVPTTEATTEVTTVATTIVSIAASTAEAIAEATKAVSTTEATRTASTAEATRTAIVVAPIQPAISSPPAVSTSKALKTYTKEPMQEIPNMTVAKRYNVSVCEDSPSGSYICIECKDPLRKKNHFSAYICCMLCRFSTCCAVAMRAHQNQAHKPPLTPLLGSVFALDRPVRCKCGFTAQGGIEIERHMKRCGTSSVTLLS